MARLSRTHKATTKAKFASRASPKRHRVTTRATSGHKRASAPLREPLIWIFGYGSLMWNPGFRYGRLEYGLVRGWHRAFCVYSHVWRGTPECPGLVLGLDRGGACKGVAFAVPIADEDKVLAYLDERERVTNVYLRRRLPVTLASGKVVDAWGYVVDRRHHQYACKLPTAQAARIIAISEGKGGTNPEYLENTILHLDQMGIPEGPLHDLRDCVRALIVPKPRTRRG
ncbi:MAG TPA: gamma-glutamylcyclotransferase [Alphaproteobacteria bacterium]|jgi:cation transport protein ChaC|nr:gamma-glutamylcyclotransferase [Alphaproteobacteria bacterium]